MKTVGPDLVYVVEGVNSDSGSKSDVIPQFDCIQNYK